MSKAVVILDYNNVFCSNYNLSRERRESIMVSILNRIIETVSSITYVEIRIYGGWYHGQELTRVGSQVMSEHLTMELFPFSKDGRTLIQGKQLIVQSVCDVDHVWYNTYREKPGIPRLIINREARKSICDDNRSHCPIHILESFARKATRICSVDGCVTDNQNAFVQMGQKMVDAMMVCDIITCSSKPDTKAVFILTDDVDLFPSIALCRSNNPGLYLALGIVNGRNVDPYKEYLKTFNVEVFQIYDVRGIGNS